MGKDSGGGGGDTVVRYAPYLEEAHQKALEYYEEDFLAARGASPYGDYVVLPFKDAMVDHDYELRDYPSLWDMFGKFMAGLDVHKLWHQTYQNVAYDGEVAAAISAHSEMLRDDIDSTVMARFLSGMRDINSVNASSFVVGKAIIYDAHVKSVSKFATELRMAALKLSGTMWSRHLDWSQAVIQVYQEMMKLYFVAHIDMEKDRLEYQAKDAMWDLNLYEHTRGILGALGGGSPITDQNVSQAQSAIGGAISGAAAGYMVGGGTGAVIGGLLGVASSFL
jgi:hypothetical protein